MLLKETGCRIGEALRLEWPDLDSESCSVNIRAEKSSRNRQAKISQRLTALILRLPHKNKLVFSGTMTGTLRNHLDKTRKRSAIKLENPRLTRIHFHTFRHWYATKTYHRTKDILYTQKALGHRSLSSTLRYTQLVNWENDNEFHVKAVKLSKEAEELVSSGWEYVVTTPEPEKAMIFRKRK
jgi:integrase/recombinase XerD